MFGRELQKRVGYVTLEKLQVEQWSLPVANVACPMREVGSWFVGSVKQAVVAPEPL